RDHALLLTGVQTGLRVSELTGLTINDIELSAGPHLRCHGKGRKDRATPLTPQTAEVLREWLTERSGTGTDPAFPTRPGARLSRDAVERLLTKHASTAAQACPSLAGKHLTPHVLRHSAAMALLHSGVDITVIALWLGHESPATTRVYLHADMAMKEQALARMTPLGSQPGRYTAPDTLLAFLDTLRPGNHRSGYAAPSAPTNLSPAPLHHVRHIRPVGIWPEPGVPQVEIEHRDPAVLLIEGELRALARIGGTLAGDEYPLHLLCHADRRDLRTAGGRGLLQVGAHHLNVAVGGLQRHQRNVVGLSERGDPAAEGVPDLLQARRRRHRVTTVIQELDHLPAHLQLPQVAVQVETVQALQIERRVPVEHVVHRDRHRSLEPGRHRNLQDVGYERRMRSPAPERLRKRKPRRYQAEPAWKITEDLVSTGLPWPLTGQCCRHAG